MKSSAIILLFALFAFVSASVTTKSAVHEKKDGSPHNVLPAGQVNSDKGGVVFPGDGSRTTTASGRSLSKESEKVEEIGSQAEVAFKNSEENDDTGMTLKKTDRLDLQTSSRVTCGSFTRCNISSYTRCWSARSTIWYVRWFLTYGNCNGKIYISGRSVCIRGGSDSCCARMYYMRA